MARTYTVSFAGVSVSAIQDLIAVYAGASMAFELHSITIGQITATSVGNLRLSVQRIPATVTAGSGGTSTTPRRGLPGDSAPTVTARINDTTQATTSGTKEQLHADAFNVVNGYQWVWPPDDRPVITPNQAVSLSLDTAPGSAEVMSGTMVIAETL